MRKVILALAPVAGARNNSINNPRTAEEVAGEVIAAAEEGASLVHLHVRDSKGNLTNDLSEFSKTVDLIKQESNIIIQGSTGGLSSLSPEQRCVALQEDRVEVASLNMGSLNMGEEVYVNTFPDIRYWAKRMNKIGVSPELEIFEAGMINNVFLLREEGVLTPPFTFGFCLGVKGALPADSYHLHYLKELLPEGSKWGCIHHGMKDFSVLAAALGMGANFIRVGFEDSFYYAPGKKASTNKSLVKKAASLIRDMGLEVASLKEAREILQLN